MLVLNANMLQPKVLDQVFYFCRIWFPFDPTMPKVLAEVFLLF